MKKVNYNMPRPILKALKERAEKEDLSAAEVVRKAVTAYLATPIPVPAEPKPEKVAK